MGVADRSSARSSCICWQRHHYFTVFVVDTLRLQIVLPDLLKIRVCALFVSSRQIAVIHGYNSAYYFIDTTARANLSLELLLGLASVDLHLLRPSSLLLNPLRLCCFFPGRNLSIIRSADMRCGTVLEFSCLLLCVLHPFSPPPTPFATRRLGPPRKRRHFCPTTCAGPVR